MTTILSGASYSTQCAAVRTNLSHNKVPPQNWYNSSLVAILACHWISPISASMPPTIFASLILSKTPSGKSTQFSWSCFSQIQLVSLASTSTTPKFQSWEGIRNKYLLSFPQYHLRIKKYLQIQVLPFCQLSTFYQVYKIIFNLK